MERIVRPIGHLYGISPLADCTYVCYNNRILHFGKETVSDGYTHD